MTNPFGVAAPIFIIVLVHVILDFFALKNDIKLVVGRLERAMYTERRIFEMIMGLLVVDVV